MRCAGGNQATFSDDTGFPPARERRLASVFRYGTFDIETESVDGNHAITNSALQSIRIFGEARKGIQYQTALASCDNKRINRPVQRHLPKPISGGRNGG
jgi:hypothetical protein